MNVPAGTAPGKQGAVEHVVVTITDTNENYRCRTDESLLTGMHRLGKRGIPVGCRGGGCSVCKVQVVAGTYEQMRPMSREYVSEEDLAQGRVLACCVRPLEEVSVAVIGKLHKSITRPGQPAA
ncbi:MAG: 2Fe-2S iron-sulfur cluster binding domain-containing protein [Acidocella sp.]|nr:2Fe-2S iron-sulfur cluster binding domain-containing protein [Acidocella sp.]